ncbi:amidohydrolase family protein [Acuticoccus sp.]|uniref:amidohydrolase family protein n=1 Tax=Acuticoccus sp. TaxID=1904378 RepID=UPI003B518941
MTANNQGSEAGAERTIPACQPPDPNPTPARFTPPDGAVDCHAHVFGPAARYAYVADRSYTPPDAPLEAYRAMLATLGLSRGVLVQPSVYGTDNTAMLDGLAADPGALRGVAVVEGDVADAELRRMHDLGVRGVRINLLFAGGTGMADLTRLCARIAPLGWHVQLLIDVSTFGDLAATLAELPVPVVFDHMGHVPVAKAEGDPGVAAMLRLIAEGRAWAKLSGAYRITGLPRLPYDDVGTHARAIVAANPERVVWASDWPHPSVDILMPNDGALLSMLEDWTPDTATRDRILTTNAWTLYDFEPPAP